MKKLNVSFLSLSGIALLNVILLSCSSTQSRINEDRPAMDQLAISADGRYGAAVDENGAVWQWEIDIERFGPPTNVTQIPNLEEVYGVAFMASNGIALKKDGTVMTWVPSNPTQVSETDMQASKKISSCLFNLLSVNADNEVEAVGNAPQDRAVHGMKEVQDVQAGGYYVLVLKQDGTVWVAGENVRNAILPGKEEVVEQTVKVEGLLNIEHIFTCQTPTQVNFAINVDKEIFYWGGPTGGKVEMFELDQVAQPIGSNFFRRDDGKLLRYQHTRGTNPKTGNRDWVNLLSPLEEVSTYDPTFFVDAVGILTSRPFMETVIKKDGSLWLWMGKAIPPQQIPNIVMEVK